MALFDLSFDALIPSSHSLTTQFATDYANSQCTSFHPFTPSSAHIYAVYPVHLAFVLLNEGAGDGPTGNISQSQIPLFASVIQKAGGDVVSTFPIISYPCVFTVS
jgi:hypothetical protein